ncbi:MAG: carboxypeptidase regulatory-like domain-containing protein [Thermoanaerobaculia bacterium]
MIPRGPWWAVVVFALAAGRVFSSDSPVSVVACRDDSGCVASAEAMEHADFVWIWSDAAPPTRVLPAEAKTILAKGPVSDIVGTINVLRRGDAAIKIIAAPVRMWAEVPEPLLPRFDVPKSGIVRIPRARSVPWRARIAGRESGSWWTPLENDATSIVLVPGMTRRIRVTDEKRAPLGSAGVTVMVARSGASRLLAAQYRTDGGGWFEIEGLPDQDLLTMIVTGKDRAPAALTDRFPQLPEAIELRRGLNVTARFVDGRDKPIGGVRVRAEAWLGSSGAVVARETASAPDGSWTIERLPADVRAVIVATREGLAPMRTDLVVEKSIDLGRIVLESGVVLPVRVIDAADRRPVEGARVVAKPDRETKTDAKGVARLIDVSPSSGLEISATADGYLPTSLQMSPPFGALVELELTRAFIVEGRFEDATGQAIAGAMARIIENNSFREMPLDEVAFRIPLPPERRVSLELSSPTSRIVRFDVEGMPGETRDLGVIHPDEGFVVRGRVATAEGMAVAAASVWIPRVSAAGPLVEWATGNVMRTQTDAAGVFALRGVGPEPVLLRIDAPGFARAFRPLSFDEAGIDLELGDIIVMRGATVSITGRTEWTDAIARVIFRPQTGEVDMLSAPMRDGAAMIRNVPAGRAVISVLRGHSTVCRKDVDLSEREEPFSVDCSAGSVHVRGTVLVGERPAAGGTLLWTSPSDGVAAGLILNRTSRLGASSQRPFGATSDVVVNVSARGEFESDDLWPGEWLVRWTSAAGGVSEPREIGIAERPDVTIVLRYEEAIVHGIVVDERSQPVRHASVRQLNGSASALTADDGTFAIVGLPPGTHRFRAEEKALRSDTAVVEVEAGRHPDPLRLIVRRDGADSVIVNVHSRAGVPATGALVFVETNTGELRIVTTTVDGRVAVSFDDGLPAAMRCAAIHDGAWVFDEWHSSEFMRDGLILAVGETGSLAVLSEEHEGMLDIRAPNGWNLTMLLMRIGSVPVLRRDAPLQLAGLPPGDYDVSISSVTRRAAIRRGETTTVTMRR